MEPLTARAETQQQLDALRARLRHDNPQIYRHWALYLQVLREALDGVIQKACFQLAVGELPERYTSLPDAARRQLHGRLAALVKRTAALLTVEQLQALAEQVQRRQRRAALRQQRRLLGAIQSPPAAAFTRSDSSAEPTSSDPPGSVHLSMDLPISSGLWSLGQGRPEADDGPSAQESEELMQVFASLLEAQTSSETPGAAQHANHGVLPGEPRPLLRWLDGLEGALARRLRNLSHAINVELVRQGLGTSLLPLRMLEAIANGQVEVQNAPPHLVRLALPAAGDPQLRLPDVLCVLLRPADLEADIAPLRTCRSRLQQARQQVRRMAQTDQRLERRLQALDAETLWLHDHSTVQPDPKGPTN